jgi:nicotinamide-nucleotide amidase
MRAEVIAIGDEIITGQRLDTNSQWLSQRLTELGVAVTFHTTIGDQREDNVAAFRAAIERADVVVATGGLGPTADDLTRESLAAAAGVGLVRDEASLEHIRSLFASRGREMPARNAVQADFPAGASPIRNEHGTAPGIALRVERRGGVCRVYALPGVPAEMTPMWHESVAPALAAALGGPRTIRHRRIKCFGVGESALEAMLPDVIRRGRDPLVGITVSDATITLRITAAGEDEEACRRAIAPTEALIRETLGNIVFGEEDDELEHVVARMLADRGLSVAVAECATAGLLAQWLSAARAARSAEGSGPFAGGVVFDEVAQLQRLLPGSPQSESAADAAVFAAEAARAAFAADYGVGVAAYPPQPDSPTARVCISVASAERTRRFRFGCATHPAIRQSRTAKQALNVLRLILAGEEPADG